MQTILEFQDREAYESQPIQSDGTFTRQSQSMTDFFKGMVLMVPIP
ncbi:hypothetical protein EVA_13092, partial [gut metagenome]